jgi:hypothetical protein
MNTENNKNLQYSNRKSVKPFRKKLKDTTSINSINSVFNTFISAIKAKHL